MAISGFMQEFKKFILRGSVVDMSVGIVIGAAFTKVVDSAVSDILMPPLGLLLGKVDFTNLFITLREGAVAGPYHTIAAAKSAGAVTINIGLFINMLISLVIVGLAIFILLKIINKLKSSMDSEIKASTKSCPYCLSSIPIKAVKCSFCTSELELVEAEALL